MNNDAGWCGSGGPWITPELSMQKVVWTNDDVEGPRRFERCCRSRRRWRIITRHCGAGFPDSGGVSHRGHPGQGGVRPAGGAVRRRCRSRCRRRRPSPRGSIVDLTAQMAKDGRLAWDVPPGKWTVLRFGHTPTGKDNHPAPLDGRGLECDKLSQEGGGRDVRGLMAKLIADSKPLVGQDAGGDAHRQLGSRLAELDAGVPGGVPAAARLRSAAVPAGDDGPGGGQPGDFRAVPLGPAADDLRADGARITPGISASWRTSTGCGSPSRPTMAACDDMTYAGRADEPMGEFWSWTFGSGADWCTEMASAAHVYGKPILGAEAFTATDKEKWLGHPGNIKALGDWAFCEGINRSSFTATRCSRGRTVTARACPWGRGACTTSARRPGGSSPRPGTSIWPAASSCSSRGCLSPTSATWRRRLAARFRAPPTPGSPSASARLQLRRLPAGGGAHAHDGQGRPAGAARRHELPRAGAARGGDDDAASCCARSASWSRRARRWWARRR